MSSVTIITLLIQTLFLYTGAASPATDFSVLAPFAAGSRSLLRSIKSGKSEKPDYAVELNATNFDSVLSETPATHAIVEFFAHWFVCSIRFIFFASFCLSLSLLFRRKYAFLIM